MIQKTKCIFRGGGKLKFVRIATPLAILIFLIIPQNIYTTELSTICTNPNSQCTLYTDYLDITNHAHFTSVINLNSKTITNFTNYGTLGNISWGSGTITHLTNYGTMGYIAGIRAMNPTPTTMSVTNYGIMGGIETQYGDKDIFIANYGVINPTNHNIHFWGTSSNQYYFVIVDYAMVITESAGVFANSRGDTSGNNNSHIVLHSQGLMRFDNENSKLILNFGGDFDFGVAYPLDKLIIGNNGENRLKVDFDRLTTSTSLYKLTQSGDSFIASIDALNSEIGILYKSNIRTMNNFYTISNSMIYPHKYSAKRAQNKRRVIRRVKRTANVFDDSSLRESALADSWQSKQKIIDCFGESCDSPRKDGWADSSLQSESNAIISSLRDSALAESWQSKYDSWIASYSTNTRNDELVALELLQSHESFSYKSNSNNYYANNLTNQRANNTTRRRITTTNRALSSPSTQSNDNYYFILTPFVNHNLFFESGRYNLSGLEYGFLTAFSGKITPSNVLGTHFMMSYGNIGDSKDKEFSITNINLNVGLNYKFDMIWDMYLKARGDFFYFLNQVKTLTIPNVKPNTLGFGVSVAYGKDFNFGNGGVLGVEGGIDYKALQSSTITLQNSADKSVSETYQKSLYNLIYVDLGMTYAKYFNTNAGIWGLNANLGLKGNVSANKLAKSQIRLSALNHSVDMVLDNDKVLGYANLSGSYVLNTKDFDMEFSVAYYGNYGDRVISNGGGVEWRVSF